MGVKICSKDNCDIIILVKIICKNSFFLFNFCISNYYRFILV